MIRILDFSLMCIILFNMIIKYQVAKMLLIVAKLFEFAWFIMR